MAGRFRYSCAECPFRTPWSTEQDGAQRRLTHYARHHPEAPPGGRVEVRGREGAGCVVLIAVLLLLLPAVALVVASGLHP